MAVLLILVGAEHAEHAAAHDLGEADDGVQRRAQFVAHIGEEFRFRLVGFLGAILFLRVFFGEVGKFGLRTLQVDHVGAQAGVIFDQLLLVLLDAGDVGADRDVAPVLGAALGDVQPASVVELRFEGAGSRRLCAGLLQPGAHFRHAADLDHGLIGGAGGYRRIRQLVQPLEMRIAEHEAVLGVPQHEGFRDRLDRVAQPEVGLHGLLGEALLFGDVDRDADQVQAAVGRGVAELAAHPQPDPVAAGVLHAEALVDVVELAGDHLVGDREQVDVVGFHQRVDFAEGEEVVAGVEPEHREHRRRPEDPAAGEVPVPQAAAAAVERGIDPAAHRVVDEIALAGAGRLPVEGEAEDQHDEARGGRQRHRQCGIRTPQRLVPFLDDDDLARQRFDQPRDRHGAIAVRKRHVVDDALLAGGGEQLRRADDVEDVVAAAEALDRDAGQDPVIGAGDDDVAAAGRAPGRNQVGQQALQPLDVGGAVLPDGARRSSRSARSSLSAARSRFMAARFCRLWSITCTKAPRQMVIRKAMMSVGTARRSAGSAMSSR